MHSCPVLFCMKLQDLHQNNSFIYLERWVNVPKYSKTAQYSEIRKRYHPRFGAARFRLPIFSLHKSEVEIYKAKPDKQMLAHVRDGDRVAFYCHPDQRNEFAKNRGFAVPAGFMPVSPTSSTRTVLAEGAARFMVKLHLNKKISRFVRRLTRSSVIHSVQISRECEKITKDKDCPKKFAYFPESIGVVHKRLGVGYLIREFVPRPIIQEKRFLIPFFALYSKDQFHPEDLPLLGQMIGAQQVHAPLEYFEKKILTPFIQCWAFAFTKYGLLFESHAQNTLLEVDEHGNPRRIVQRDFQSIPIDPDIRAQQKLPNHFKKHIIGREDYPKLLEHSLLYDHFVCDYLFGSFATFFEEYYGISKDDFYAMAKRVYGMFIGKETERAFFPKGHVTFGESTTDNVVPLLYLHENPLGRPSY